MVLMKNFVSEDALKCYFSKDYRVEFDGDMRKYGIFLACSCMGLPAGVIVSTGDAGVAGESLVQLSKWQRVGMDFPPEGPAGDIGRFTLIFENYVKQDVQWSYVFASNELPEWGGSQYNDIFEMTVNNDPVAFLDADAENFNMALTVSRNTVTINNLVPNADGARWTGNSYLTPGKRGPSLDHLDYVDNPNYKCFGSSGYTRKLTARGQLVIGTNFIDITVMDITDGKYDSAVFLQKNGLVVTGARDPIWAPAGTNVTDCSVPCTKPGARGVWKKAYRCVTPCGEILADESECSRQGPKPSEEAEVTCGTAVPACVTEAPTSSPTRETVRRTPAPVAPPPSRTGRPTSVLVPVEVPIGATEDPAASPPAVETVATDAPVAPARLPPTNRVTAAPLDGDAGGFGMCGCNNVAVTQIETPAAQLDKCWLFCDNSDESGPRRCCWYPSAWALCQCVYDITVTNTQSWRDNWGTNPCRQVANPTHLVQQLANDVTYEGGGANDAGLELPPFSPKTPQFSNLQKNGNRVVQRVCDALFPPPTAPPLRLSGASIITAPMALVAASATLLALFR